MESIVRGNKSRKKKEGENSRMRGWCSGIYFYKNMRRRTGKRRKEQHRQWAMNQGWERREQREFIAIPRFCCSVFFLLTQWTCREQAAFFYRSHATSQWSMDAGPLQTYTVEHALCGSAKRGHLGERGRTPPPLPLLPSILSAALLPIIPLLCTYFSTSPFFPISPTLTESLLKMVATKVWWQQMFIVSFSGL